MIFFLVIYIQQLRSIKVDLDKNTRYHVNDREKIELTMRSYTEVTLIHTSITIKMTHGNPLTKATRKYVPEKHPAQHPRQEEHLRERFQAARMARHCGRSVEKGTSDRVSRRACALESLFAASVIRRPRRQFVRYGSGLLSACISFELLWRVFLSLEIGGLGIES